MLTIRLVVALVAMLVTTSAVAGGRRAIPGQAANVPLFTALRPDDERGLAEVLRFDHFQRDRLAPWRARLTPLAESGDPLAQLWLGRLYDLYPYGQGTPDDGRIALMWYQRAADQHLAVAEQLLFHVYASQLLAVPRDDAKARAFLERARVDSAGALRAEVCLDLARLYAATGAGAAPDPARSMSYLEQALQADPDNQSAIDWLVGIYAERGDHARAIAVVERSRNAAMLEKIAELCIHELQDTRCAIRLLERAKPFPRADATPPQALMELYTLVCRRQLLRSRLAAIEMPRAWKIFQQQQRNCVVEPGG